MKAYFESSQITPFHAYHYLCSCPQGSGMEIDMKTESAVILTKTREEEDVSTRYRLITTFDAFCGAEVFSVLLTTRRGKEETEDFVYDIARDEDEAARFFSRIVEYRVTARHLREIAEDFLCEAASV